MSKYSQEGWGGLIGIEDETEVSDGGTTFIEGFGGIHLEDIPGG